MEKIGAEVDAQPSSRRSSIRRTRAVDLSNVEPACLLFAQAVERLRNKRYHELSIGSLKSSEFYWKLSHVEWPNFTFDQFRRLVYPGYTKLRQGHVASPPPRTVISEIADYFQCSLEERNYLYVSAGYAPIPPRLTGKALQSALDRAIDIANYLPLPAMVVTRDWDIHYFNDLGLVLAGLTREQLAHVPPSLLNVIDLICDERSPSYRAMIADVAAWEAVVRLDFAIFKQDNAMHEKEAWYCERVARWHQLPNAANPLVGRLWDETELDAVNYSASLQTPIAVQFQTGEMIQVWSLTFSPNHEKYPVVFAYMPANEHSRAVFARAGFPTPEIWTRR